MAISAINGFDEIRELSEETQDKVFKNPSKSVGIINGVGGNVLKQFSSATDCPAVIAFLKSVVYLNDKYQTQLSERPFNEIITKLQSALKKVGLGPSEIQPLIVKLEQQFKVKLSSLDLESRTFPSEIRELIVILEKLEKFQVITPGQNRQLGYALQSLRSKSHFRESFFERRALSILCKKSSIFKTAMEKAEQLLSSTGREGQKLMLEYLKQSDLPLNELAKKIPNQLKSIEKKLIETRLGIVISRMPASGHLFGEKFITNFYHLMNALENFGLNVACTVCDRVWGEILIALDPEKNGELLKVLEGHPDLDPDEITAELSQLAEANYVKPLSIDELCRLDLDAFNTKIAKMNEGVDKKMSAFFDAVYKKYFMDMHLWLATNLKALKLSYNQAAHTSQNMGNGTCLQNSLERYSFLLIDPYKDGTKIPMGSSSKGRVGQATVNHSFREAKKGLLSIDEASKIQQESSRKFGLKGAEKIEITAFPNLPEAVTSQLNGLSKNGFQGIIFIALPSGAHAFNIQINHQLQIFRFIDDNIGVCEWSDYKQFQEQFPAYLKAFYPDHNRFSLQQYTLTK